MIYYNVKIKENNKNPVEFRYSEKTKEFNDMLDFIQRIFVSNQPQRKEASQHRKKLAECVCRTLRYMEDDDNIIIKIPDTETYIDIFTNCK